MDTRDSVQSKHICKASFLEISDVFPFASVMLACMLSHFSPVWLFVTPWTAARQASLSITSSRSPPKLTSIESVMPSNHLILCRPLLLLPSIFPSIRVFSNESALHMRWPKYWSFSFSVSPLSHMKDAGRRPEFPTNTGSCQTRQWFPKAMFTRFSPKLSLSFSLTDDICLLSSWNATEPNPAD